MFNAETDEQRIFLQWRGLCVDINECVEQNVQCPVNQKCFNKRGGYECVDTSCPPDYDRDPNTG